MNKFQIKVCKAIIALRKFAYSNENAIVAVMTTLLVITIVDGVLLIIGTML